MKKSICFNLIFVLICSRLAALNFKAIDNKLVIDYENLLNLDESKSLHLKLEELAQKSKIQFILVTLPESGNYDIENSIILANKELLAANIKRFVIFIRDDNGYSFYISNSLNSKRLKPLLEEKVGILKKRIVKSYCDEFNELVDILTEKQTLKLLKKYSYRYYFWAVLLTNQFVLLIISALCLTIFAVLFKRNNKKQNYKNEI